MGDLLARLQTALGDTYHVDKELGGGGMSRLFLATETSLHRQVVIKLLPPEYASEVSAARFKQEIALAAHLQHPNILPVLTAGATDDLLFYVMPFVPGETLRHRLTRERQLPVADAVRILHEVADALAHAHAAGVIHRDIKPENILLEGEHAVLTDFGIARALVESHTGGRLTDTGVVPGTPGYMSPEQAAGERNIDGRADVYALAVVGYEMLAGSPPFRGRTARAVMAAHLTETPPPLTDERRDTPPAVASAIARALAKDPGSRLGTAAEFRDALGVAYGHSAPRRARTVRVAVGAAVLVAAGAVAAMLMRSKASTLLNSNVVAVAPFRVSGADSSLDYLREGMVDLLAAKLTGEGGLRAADPRSTISAWRRSGGTEDTDVPEETALRLAARLGAGQLLLGGVVGTPRHVALNATLLTVPSGRTRAQVSVEGPPDSVPVLLDRLVAQLLAKSSGVEEQRVRSLTTTTTSLEALRAYLDGQSEYRHGHYRQAATYLERALQLDSTFALAAFALAQTAGWGGVVRDAPRVERLAWELRGRLSARDQTLLSAALGPRYPWSSRAEVLAATERAVEAVPEQAEAWYFLGDQYYHFGAYLGIPDAWDRATVAFRRALAIDSTFAGPLGHLAHLRALAGDTADFRRLATLYLRVDSTSSQSFEVRWQMSVFLRDPHIVADMRARLDSGTLDAIAIPFRTDEDGVGLEDVDRALVAEQRAATTQGNRAFVKFVSAAVAFNGGRPHEADSLAATGLRGLGLDRLLDYWRLVSALYWDGDTRLAAEAARGLAKEVDGPLSASLEQRPSQYDHICMLEQWRLWNGTFASAARDIARLKSAAVPRDSAEALQRLQVCAALLEAVYALRRHAPDAGAWTNRLDSLMRTGPAQSSGWENLVLTRLWAQQGDSARALAAVRRREYDWRFPRAVALSSYLREEGRLAAIMGDRQEAIQADQHYLALRSHPDRSVQADVDQVRADLVKLLSEQRH